MRNLIGTATALAVILSSTTAGAFTVGTADFGDPVPTGATSATKQLMQSKCTELASLHGPAWTGTLDLTSIDDGSYVEGSVQLSGNRTQVGPAVGIGEPIPESIQVVGDPYRVGGSVNMFGLAQVVAAHYADSEYDFTQSATWSSEYNFTCNMQEAVPTPALGVHEWTGPSNAGQNAKDNCEGDRNPHEFDDRGEACTWRETTPAGSVNEDRDPEDDSIVQPGESGSVNGHENSGGQLPVDLNADPVDPVQVVVCISPSTSSKKTQDNGWARKNGYNGNLCTTTWYNTGALTASATAGISVNTGSNNIVTIPQT